METNTKQYLEVMKEIQTNLLDYLDYEDDIEGKYENLISIFNANKFHENQFKIKSLFHLILKITKNHHHGSDFYCKIEKILKLFKNDMKKYFPNFELFNIFKSNKRLLLFLLEESIMIIDEFIANKIIAKIKYKNAQYPQYFQPEIQPFINENTTLYKVLKNKLPEDFYEKRKIGENDNEICKMIQKDLIEDFIIYINQNNFPISSKINSSIYETNNFLLKNKDLTLIEYAVFYGSIQIFNYLRQNGAELKPSLWLFAIHGKNPEIINFLEENKILPSKIKETNYTFEPILDGSNYTFEPIFKESIKCHHIDITNYILDNYIQNVDEDTLIDGLKYYNFMFIPSDIENETSFYYLCKYDYILLVDILLKTKNIHLNTKLIYIVIF